MTSRTHSATIHLGSNESLPSTTENRKPNCLQRAAAAISGALENFFYKLGLAIAKRPKTTIATVMIAYLSCLVGAINFSEIKITDPVWVDPKSDFITQLNWIKREFPDITRYNSFIAEGDNLLTPKAVKELLNIHKSIIDIRGDGYTYETVCTRYGLGDNSRCWATSILELWKFDQQVIESLTVEDILHSVNNVSKSPVTNADIYPIDYLGDLSRNSSGYITAAKAALFMYFLQATNSTDSAGDEQALEHAMSWEKLYIDKLRGYSPGSEVKAVYPLSSRSFDDELNSDVNRDTYLLSGGYVLLIIFVSVIIGNCNCIDLRVYLAIGCVLGVGLSMGVALGFCSAISIPYSPVVAILPFLLLGLGVDDGFVIVQSWSQVTSENHSLSVSEQAGRALKHAGVSITVTSVTDVVSFAIGATTLIPVLQHFYIFGTVAIIAVFIVQATMFTAICVLDVQRRDSLRNGLLCCYKHEPDYEPKPCSRRNLQQMFFEKVYGPFLTRLPVKITAIALSLGLLGLGIYSVRLLEQQFSRESLFKGSYIKEYTDKMEEHFSHLSADNGFIYFNERNYYEERSIISSLMEDVKQQSYIIENTVDFWFEDYVDWLEKAKCPWIRSHVNANNSWPLNRVKFDMLTIPFLYLTSEGQRHLKDFKFTKSIEFPATFNHTLLIYGSGYPLSLNLSTADVLTMEDIFTSFDTKITRAPFDFVGMDKSSDKVDAMDGLREVVRKYYTIDKAFCYSEAFRDSETDKIIQGELYRNIGLAFICVVVITLFLIADIGMCILVSICVLASMVEIGGMMYFWGLYIDTVTCLLLVSGVGLTVDYSAHVGHTYMTVRGTRNERAIKTIAGIGPAVFNGGFSTLLAVLPLNFAVSFVFEQFLKVGVLIVCIGLWNGLVFLPAVLSIIGPPAYISHPRAVAPGTEAKDTAVEMTPNNEQRVKKQEVNRGYVDTEEADAVAGLPGNL